jgi:O-antigen ligase
MTSHTGFSRRPTAVLLLVGTVAATGLLVDTGAGFAHAMGRDGLSGRTDLWDQLISMPVDPVFGAGFESFWLGPRVEHLWKIYWWHPNQAHNGYLEVFLNLGWAGLALLGVVMLWGYRNVVRAFQRDPRVAQLRLAYFVVAPIYNLTEASFKMMHPVWIAFLLSIIAVPETLEEGGP